LSFVLLVLDNDATKNLVITLKHISIVGPVLELINITVQFGVPKSFV